MRRWWLAGLGLFVLAGMASALDYAGGNPVTVAFYEFGYLYSRGKGIDKDIVDELSRRTGVVFHPVEMTRARIWSDLEAGILDMTVSGVQTPDRDRFAWFAPYLISRNMVVLNRDSAGSIPDFKGFLVRADLRLGVVRSFLHGVDQDEWIAVLRQLGRIDESPDSAALFLKLSSGRIDAAFAHPAAYRFYMDQMAIGSRLLIQDWSPTDPGLTGGLVLSRRRFTARQAKLWQDTVAAMHKDGTLRVILAKYLGDELAVTMTRF